ncbi:hypothetical protein V6Z11_A05G086200 [Gossypium hirsutum]
MPHFLPHFPLSNQITLSRQLEIDKGRHHFGTRLRMRVSGNGLSGETIECAAKRTIPGPLVEFTISVEVSIAILASRQKMSVQSIGRLIRDQRPDKCVPN